MSFPAYERMKLTGIEWLGKVPNHWSVEALKRNVKLVTDKADQRRRSVALENIESWSGRLVETDTEFEGDGVEFAVGDILFGKLRPYLAKVYVASFAGEAVGDFHVLRPLNGLASRFAGYQLLNREVISVIDGSTFGAKMPRVSWEFLGGLRLPRPPTDEQLAIVAFLDRETAKIDELVAEQQLLIELLKQKRKAVISHAVTKGLDPNTPMKESGVDWLGEVPAHWKLVMAKRVADVFVPQRNKPDLNEEGEGVPWVTMEDMAFPDIRSSALHVSSEAAVMAGSRVLEKGAVIASCVGSFGVSAINRVDVVINQQLQAFVPKLNVVVPEFLRLYLWSSASYFESVATAATIAYVNQDQFGRLPLAIPTIEEQRKIVAATTQSIELIDELVVQTKLAIELLQERRAALISAAVTGKIDVRGLVVADTPTPNVVAA